MVAYDRFPTNRRTANQCSSNGSEISRVDEGGRKARRFAGANTLAADPVEKPYSKSSILASRHIVGSGLVWVYFPFHSCFPCCRCATIGLCLPEQERSAPAMLNQSGLPESCKKRPAKHPRTTSLGRYPEPCGRRLVALGASKTVWRPEPESCIGSEAICCAKERASTLETRQVRPEEVLWLNESDDRRRAEERLREEIQRREREARENARHQPGRAEAPTETEIA